MAKESFFSGVFEEAESYIEKALAYPVNLGEGRLEGTKDNHLHYWMGRVKECTGRKEEAQICWEKAGLGAQEPAGMLYYYDQPADMILYQGMAKLKQGRKREANARFYKLIDYGERHVRDKVKMDYFAVSLPDFLIFEEDLDRRNQAHCYYLMGLGKLGLGRKEEAEKDFDLALSLDPNHQNALIYKKMICREGQLW